VLLGLAVLFDFGDPLGTGLANPARGVDGLVVRFELSAALQDWNSSHKSPRLNIHSFLLGATNIESSLATKRVKAHHWFLIVDHPKGAWLFWQANSFSEGSHSRITTK